MRLGGVQTMVCTLTGISLLRPAKQVVQRPGPVTSMSCSAFGMETDHSLQLPAAPGCGFYFDLHLRCCRVPNVPAPHPSIPESHQAEGLHPPPSPHII